MNGKIVLIKELYGYKPDKDKWGTYEGYQIVTNEGEILVLISDMQNCCESFGYFSSDDDLQDFVGAKLQEINLTDTALNKTALQKNDLTEDCFDCGGIQFVDFVTDKGTFQLAVYNAHNGYYGHDIMIRVNDKIIHEGTL